MKIALSFPAIERAGGVERVALECANFLAARDHEVLALCARAERDALDERVQICPVPSRERPPALRLISYALASRRVLRACEGVEAVGSFGVQSPPGVLWVQSVHAAWLRIASERRCWRGRVRQKLNPVHPVALRLEREMLAGRRYDKLLALSPSVKADLQEFYGVPDEDVVVVPNGYAPDEFNLERRARDRDATRANLGLVQNEKIVLFVANELERKGFFPLLRALHDLNERDVHLVAVGRFDAAPARAVAKRLGLEKRVHFPGSTRDVGAFFAAADVFALPTQYEAWGLVIVEALACGVPVLTSRCAGAASAVRENGPNSTGALLENPDDTEEIASKLRPLLEARHANFADIGASVEALRWERVLLSYEAALCEAATTRLETRSTTRALIH